MTDAELNLWRRAVRAGELPDDLVGHLHGAVLGVVRRRALPPSFAPYGQWDDEAAEELFSSWYAERLLEQHQLLALLDRVSSKSGLRGLVERSLRQHLLNTADRSQARNVFARVVELLRDRHRYVVVRDSSRASDTWFALAPPGGPGLQAPLWSGGQRELAGWAWDVGDLHVIRYRASAAKLSPVLDTPELERFVTGMLERADAALTPQLLMAALAARVDLGEPQVHELDDARATPSREPSPEAQVIIGATAHAVVDELSTRQRQVLLRADEPVASVARGLSCSVGTVVNERRRIGTLIARHSGDDEERETLLNAVLDRLYLSDDE